MSEEVLLTSKNFSAPEGCDWEISSDIQGVNRNLVIQFSRIINEVVSRGPGNKEDLFEEADIYVEYLDNLSEKDLVQVAGGVILILAEEVKNSQLEREEKEDLIYRYGSNYRWFFWQAGQLNKGGDDSQIKFLKARYPVVLKGAVESLVGAVNDKKDEGLILDYGNLFRTTFRFLELSNHKETVMQLRGEIEVREGMTELGLKMFDKMFEERFED